MMTEPLRGGAGRKPKFRKGQVVMVQTGSRDRYPVKLERKTRIGSKPNAWFDSLGNVEYEEEMRPLTQREKGKP